MIQIQVTTASGNGWTTGFNGTLSEARSYFLGDAYVTESDTGKETRDTITGVAFVGSYGQLRVKAWEAKRDNNYELAAELYQAAFEAFPLGDTNAQAEENRKDLRMQARSMRTMALRARQEVAA
jgi:hypothetical protein